MGGGFYDFDMDLTYASFRLLDSLPLQTSFKWPRSSHLALSLKYFSSLYLIVSGLAALYLLLSPVEILTSETIKSFSNSLLGKPRWSYLQVESNERMPDELQAYAAGALEAHLTRQRMEQHWTNLFSGYCENQAEYCRQLEDFSTRNIKYTREQQHQRRHNDTFWNMLHLHMKQLAGLSDAWENETLDFTHEISGVTRAFILNLVGDLQDLERALGRKKDLHSFDQILACTALVKIVGDFDDLYVAHDTWFLYRGMLRVQKKYIFPWHHTASDTTVGGGSKSLHSGSIFVLPDGPELVCQL
ncbi:putative phospholipase B-like 2 [Dermacentor variabilis]|uniref:putative phospholipase B-like 2 n=1 Tax=Dermacentor variabilis TaxID=34621 RepID=UPI003F5B8674